MEMQTDAELVHLRKFALKKQFYKGSAKESIQKDFQVGTVIEGMGEFYSARIPQKQRKKTFVEEMQAEMGNDIGIVNKRIQERRGEKGRKPQKSAKKAVLLH
ncbi:MAG: hypothetical protein EZS28_022781 [Streblomastix strix]|uniref:Fcf2 pre-rRNA processing C-terminal domain-containing protein n=1 Tax=Streblomastix strix TaxID=222440 RepID=A0A5J4VGM8_9EUKA|nr:MAG: hypothetical protein EZS28_022781 [Streblomastix strix]